ncbi:MAG: hypothetical protein F7C82_06995 [Desulfurococcales archaeon]|nr:hypothetical protein [Desulfurococcales archaeon]MCE4622200.1 hypothetical protein [Desulfurococcales archaeon]MCE4626441.1 hypothetical protein [Desulfurococcales archaeon]MCE4630010.1 hypothetical protein [Desulfurococcales archaeon]
MVPVKATIDARLVARVRSKILKEFETMRQTLDTEDIGIEITLALSDEEIEKLVMMALREAQRPISWREFKQIFAGIVGEDRLRRILANLKARDIIVELTRTRYSLPEYVPVSEISKVKNPRVLSKVLRRTTIQ